MAPRASTRVRPVAKAATATNGASAAPPASKKRKAAEAEPEAKAAPAKKTKGRGFNVKDLDEAIKDIDPAKKPRKTAEAKKKSPRPAPKRAAAAAAPAFDIEPSSTLTDFKTKPPNATSLPVINHAPTEVLTICVFGTGDMSGDLGLGPKKKVVSVPTVIPELDGRKEGTYRVVQVACGGMHTLALTEDSKIVTWGGNDEGALGRNSAWNGGLRDMDAEKDDAGNDAASNASEDSDDAGLNPVESTPIHIPESSFPAGTRFTSVAAGDSCSFAVTDTGLVYGWGTFAVSLADATSFALHALTFL